MTKEVKKKVKKDAFMAFRNGGVAPSTLTSVRGYMAGCSAALLEQAEI